MCALFATGPAWATSYDYNTAVFSPETDYSGGTSGSNCVKKPADDNHQYWLCTWAAADSHKVSYAGMMALLAGDGQKPLRLVIEPGATIFVADSNGGIAFENVELVLQGTIDQPISCVAKHDCSVTFNACDPEGQALTFQMGFTDLVGTAGDVAQTGPGKCDYAAHFSVDDAGRGALTVGVLDGNNAPVTFVVNVTASANQAPPTPTTTQPNAIELDFANAIPFTFGTVTDPEGDDVSYRIRVADNAEFTNAIVESGITSKTLPHALAATLSDGTWHWQVKALDEFGAEIEWSASASFTVKLPVVPVDASQPDALLDTETDPDTQTVADTDAESLDTPGPVPSGDTVAPDIPGATDTVSTSDLVPGDDTTTTTDTVQPDAGTSVEQAPVAKSGGGCQVQSPGANGPAALLLLLGFLAVGLRRRKSDQ